MACGKRIPSWRQKDEAQAPADNTATFVRIVPFSVTTPAILPPASSTPRAAHSWWTVPPSFMNARATAGAALDGSAVPSVGEKTPPFHGLPVHAARSVASAGLNTCVMTPTVRAKSCQRAQRASSSSSLLR